MIHASGNNYNKFENIHILTAQMGVHLGKGTSINKFNNNRNNFKNIRVSGAWIGYLIEEADGNTFDSMYAENITLSASPTGHIPSQLPSELNGKPTALVILDGQLYFFDKFGVENAEFHLYSVGFRYYFKNRMVRDDAASRMLVMFPRADRQPLYYTSNISITPYLK